MPQEIVLADGKITLVSDEDFVYLSYWRWSSGGHGYVQRGSNKGPLMMHKIIAERIGLNGKVDHKDRNILNNQRGNLRIANRQQNAANSGTMTKNTSGYRGVSYNKLNKNWRAQIQVNGRNQHIGSFATSEQAALAYNLEAKKHFGDFAFQNKV